MNCFRLCLLPLFVWALASSAPAQSLGSFFHEFWEEQLKDQPELASRIGRSEYGGLWTDYSKAARQARRARLQRRLQQASQFDLARLTPEEKLSLRLLTYDLRVQLDALDANELLLPVGQLFGLHTNVIQAFDAAPNRTVQDYEQQLQRLQSIPKVIDQRLAVLDEALSRRITQPRVVVDRVLAQIAQQLQQSPEESALLAAFRRFPATVPAVDQQRLKAQATAAYVNSFQPAWKKLHEYLRTKYLPAARPSIGVTSLDGGSQIYTALVRSLTTTTMTPEEIRGSAR